MSFIGPALPPHLRNSESPPRDAEDSSASYGPSLPPHLLESKPKPSSKEPLDSKRNDIINSNNKHESEDEEDSSELIGPLPPSAGEGTNRGSLKHTIAQEIEARASKTKEQMMADPEAPKRDSWMLELPENSKAFGLGPRQFSRKTELSSKDKDRTGWTQIQGKETQESRKEKDGYDQECLEYLASLKKDSNMEKICNDMNKKRGSDSLLDLHQKKLKQKKKEDSSEDGSERRPFDRDVDLQANRFDNATKNRLLKQSRGLNDKFSSGASKFL